jgi:Ulp1 family protease
VVKYTGLSPEILQKVSLKDERLELWKQFTNTNYDIIYGNCNKQSNDIDCGVFVLAYAHSMVNGNDVMLPTAKNIDDYRLKFQVELYNFMRSAMIAFG